MPNATKRTPAARGAASASKPTKAAPTKVAKAAPAKAPAAKTTPAPRKAAPRATTAVPKPKPEKLAPGTILFHGRVMKVHKLAAEQLGIWRRMQKRFVTLQGEMEAARARAANGNPEEVAAALAVIQERAGRALDQVIELITSVLADEVDHDWIESELLHKRMDLLEAANVITLAVQSFVDGHNTKAPNTGPPMTAAKARRVR